MTEASGRCEKIFAAGLPTREKSAREQRKFPAEVTSFTGVRE